jgi:hypothetical protein
MSATVLDNNNLLFFVLYGLVMLCTYLGSLAIETKIETLFLVAQSKESSQVYLIDIYVSARLHAFLPVPNIINFFQM